MIPYCTHDICMLLSDLRHKILPLFYLIYIFINRKTLSIGVPV